MRNRRTLFPLVTSIVMIPAAAIGVMDLARLAGANPTLHEGWIVYSRRSQLMDPNKVFCHNPDCPAMGKLGGGNIGIHSCKKRRYICHVCGWRCICLAIGYIGFPEPQL